MPKIQRPTLNEESKCQDAFTALCDACQFKIQARHGRDFTPYPQKNRIKKIPKPAAFIYLPLCMTDVLFTTCFQVPSLLCPNFAVDVLWQPPPIFQIVAFVSSLFCGRRPLIMEMKARVEN